MLDHVDQLTGKLRERVKEHGRQARMSKDLATIYCDVPLGFSVEDTRYEGYDRGRVAALFERLEFKSLLERIGGKESVSGSSRKLRKVEVQTVEPEDRESWNDFLENPLLSLWLEMDGKNYHRAEIIGLALSDRETHLYVPWRTARDWENLHRLLADEERKKIVYDGKRLQVVLKRRGSLRLADWPSTRFSLPDLLDPSESGHSLSDPWSSGRWTDPFPRTKRCTGKGRSAAFPGKESGGAPGPQGGGAEAPLSPAQRGDPGGRHGVPAVRDGAAPSRVLAEMELHGVRVDRDRLLDLGEELKEQAESLTRQIYELAGTELEIYSPKQLAEILYDKLGLPVLKKTKTG